MSASSAVCLLNQYHFLEWIHFKWYNIGFEFGDMAFTATIETSTLYSMRASSFEFCDNVMAISSKLAYIVSAILPMHKWAQATLLPLI